MTCREGISLGCSQALMEKMRAISADQHLMQPARLRGAHRIHLQSFATALVLALGLLSHQTHRRLALQSCSNATLRQHTETSSHDVCPTAAKRARWVPQAASAHILAASKPAAQSKHAPQPTNCHTHTLRLRLRKAPAN